MRHLVAPWVWRVAWRDGKRSFGKLLRSMACVVIGIASLVAALSFSAHRFFRRRSIAPDRVLVHGLFSGERNLAAGSGARDKRAVPLLRRAGNRACIGARGVLKRCPPPG